MNRVLKFLAVKENVSQFMREGESLPVRRVQSIDPDDRHIATNMCQPGELIVQWGILDAYAKRFCDALDRNGYGFNGMLFEQRPRRPDSLAPVGLSVHGERFFKRSSAKAEASRVSIAGDLLLPLRTALERELGLEPRVAREVEEIAEDIRRELLARPNDGGQRQ